MHGRVNIVKEKIRDSGVKTAALSVIVDAVKPSLVRLKDYATLGGSEGTIIGDVRRALQALRKEGLAEFAGVTSTGRWTIKRVRAKA